MCADPSGERVLGTCAAGGTGRPDDIVRAIGPATHPFAPAAADGNPIA